MSKGQNGKGSSRRKENPSKVRENWEAINWKKESKNLDTQPKPPNTKTDAKVN